MSGKLSLLTAQRFKEHFKGMLALPLVKDRFITIRYSKNDGYVVKIVKIENNICSTYREKCFRSFKEASEYFDEQREFMTNFFLANGYAA